MNTLDNMSIINAALKKNIRNYIDHQNISVNTLEKKAGLKPTAIHNILLGRSKNPSIDILSKIANTVGCTVDSLISDQPHALPLNSRTHWDGTLYYEATSAVYEKLRAYKDPVPTHIAIKCITHTYEYAVQKSNTIDQNFIDWIIEKLLSEQSQTA